MARSLSATALAAMHAPQTGEVYLVLLQIDHATFGAPMRFVNNLNDVVSGGNAYTAYPFAFEIPDEDAAQLPRVALSIDNVSRAITDALRALATAPTITAWIVLASSPSTIEAGPWVMTLQDINYTAFVVTGRLGYEQMLDEPYPAGTFNPVDWPALY